MDIYDGWGICGVENTKDIVKLLESLKQTSEYSNTTKDSLEGLKNGLISIRGSMKDLKFPLVVDVLTIEENIILQRNEIKKLKSQINKSQNGLKITNLRRELERKSKELRKLISGNELH